MKKSTLVITEVIAFLFMVLFLYTSISKILTFGSFQTVLSQSPLIRNYFQLVAFSIPTLEILITILLFFPKTRLKGLYAATALMTAFTLYIAYMLKFTPNLPCQCGGVLRQMNWTQHLYFNSAFVIMGVAGIWLTKNNNKSTSSQSQIVPG